MEKIYGLHAVSAALEKHPGNVRGLWVQRGGKDARLDQVLSAARKAGVVTRRVDRRTLDHMAPGVRHQGVVAEYVGKAQKGEPELAQLLDRLQVPPLLLILDGVQDPHNLGACLRTGDAAGIHAVVAPRDRAVGLTPAVRKVASGAADTLPFIQVTNLARVMKSLGQRGLWLVGAAGEAETSLFEADLTGPLALVLGSEGKGLRRLTREHCDSLVSIPMQGTVPSLNVSVAAGICLFEALRQRSLGQ